MRRDVHVLPDVRGHVHAVPEAYHDLGHGGRVRGLQAVREQAVPNVLQAVDLPGDGLGLGGPHGLQEAYAVVEAPEQAVAEVLDSKQGVGGESAEDERRPVRAVVWQRRREAERGHGVHADVSPAPEREDLQDKVEWAGHGARVCFRGVNADGPGIKG